MKTINFITSPSPSHQRNTRRWFLISFVLFGVAFVVIGVKQIRQLWKLLDTQSVCSLAEQQGCTSNECLNNHRLYAEQSRTITQKLDQILTIQNSLTRAAGCLQDISCGVQNSILEHCDIRENKARLLLRIPNQEHIQLLTHTLSNTKWAQHVLLESITAAQSDGALITVSISLGV